MKRASLLALVILTGTAAMAAERSEVISKSYPAPEGKTVLIDAGPLDLFVRSAEIGDIRLNVQLSAGAFKSRRPSPGSRPTGPRSRTARRSSGSPPRSPRLSLLKGVVVSKARVELVLPTQVRPDLSTSTGALQVEGEFALARPLRLRCGSGDMEFTGWAPELEVRSTSGDIRLRATRAFETLLARSASGEVILTGGARRVRCDTSSGAIRLDGLLGPVGIATPSGTVNARFDALEPNDEVRITTSSGKVRVTLPPGATPAGEITSAKERSALPTPGRRIPKVVGCASPAAVRPSSSPRRQGASRSSDNREWQPKPPRRSAPSRRDPHDRATGAF